MIDPTPVPDDRLLTLRETATRLAVSERFVRSLIASGRLRRLCIGRVVRIDRRDLDSFIERAKRGRP